MTSQPSTIELEVEVPGTAEEVWTAIATGAGISSWYVPHVIEERAGGGAVASFGPGDDMKVPGRVTVWDPPRHVGFDGGEGSEDGLTFDWTIEPVSGSDRCVVRLVNAGFGQGGPWDEVYEAMIGGWRMFLFNLRLHLEHFGGREAVPALPTAVWTGPRSEAWARLMGELGLNRTPMAGDRLELKSDGAPALVGSVVSVEPTWVSLLLDEPSPGTGFIAVEGDGDDVQVSVWTYRYGDDRGVAAEADRSGWQSWLSARAPS
ncbi:MAG: SRPBCC domain-containing protein [Acidimicrobiia bacterium]|nr:SRPBCC domain-containing protein [Acidimicrobiia bacterium]